MRSCDLHKYQYQACKASRHIARQQGQQAIKCNMHMPCNGNGHRAMQRAVQRRPIAVLGNFVYKL